MMSGQLLTDRLKEEMIHSLADSSGEERRAWIEYIVDQDIALADLVEILYCDYKTAMRFSWIIGSLCEIDSKRVFPVVQQIFRNRERIKIPNFDRSMAKMFYLAGIPDELEGEAVDIMFAWMLDPKILVSTKNFSLFALYNTCLNYGELKNELKVVIEDQLDKNSKDFKKRAMKVLKKLE